MMKKVRRTVATLWNKSDDAAAPQHVMNVEALDESQDIWEKLSRVVCPCDEV